MNAYSNRSLSVALLLYISRSLSAVSRGVRAIARSLDRWLEGRRAARVALRELSAMSDRELRDIGIARSDIEYVAAQAVTRRDGRLA